jgi:ABC-type multidrug transport system fused ATPase/permease subunit
MSIDGMDTSTMNLDTLRSALSIIPQEPMFFSGSIARNIDPFGTRSEEELWVALRKAGVSGTVAALPGGLNFTLSENGDNFSAGQKQQLCLARALVRQSRILFLDEATSSVDSDTDALIQRTIRTEFGDGNCTTLTIAHRLDSIADCDRILVMDAGRVVEFDSPARLLMNPQSLYSRLVQADRVSRKDVSAEATGTANARATSTSPKAGKKDQQNPKRGYMPASR